MSFWGIGIEKSDEKAGWLFGKADIKEKTSHSEDDVITVRKFFCCQVSRSGCQWQTLKVYLRGPNCPASLRIIAAFF